MGGNSSKTLVADSSRAALRHVPQSKSTGTVNLGKSAATSATSSSTPQSDYIPSTNYIPPAISSSGSIYANQNPHISPEASIPQYPSPMSSIKGPNPYAETDPSEKPEHVYEKDNVLNQDLLEKIKGWQPEVKTYSEVAHHIYSQSFSFYLILSCFSSRFFNHPSKVLLRFVKREITFSASLWVMLSIPTVAFAFAEITFSKVVEKISLLLDSSVREIYMISSKFSETNQKIKNWIIKFFLCSSILVRKSS